MTKHKQKDKDLGNLNSTLPVDQIYSPLAKHQKLSPADPEMETPTIAESLAGFNGAKVGVQLSVTSDGKTDKVQSVAEDSGINEQDEEENDEFYDEEHMQDCRLCGKSYDDQDNYSDSCTYHEGE
jgi:hypothetical protein